VHCAVMTLRLLKGASASNFSDKVGSCLGFCRICAGVNVTDEHIKMSSRYFSNRVERHSHFLCSLCFGALGRFAFWSFILNFCQSLLS
jgi:hypothetical protein